MSVRPPSTRPRVATIRCTQLACPAVRRISYTLTADRDALLEANSRDPWRCKRHGDVRRVWVWPAEADWNDLLGRVA